MEDGDYGILDDDPVTLPGQLARELRKKAGLSLKKVAEILGDGTHFTTIAKLEKGTMAFTYDWAVKLAPVYGVPHIGFFIPQEQENRAKRIPVFGSAHQLIASTSKLTPDSYTSYFSSKDDLFGLGFTGPADLAGESGLYTAIIDPNTKHLLDGLTYAVADPLSESSFCVGVYRDDGSPRLIPWPAPREGNVDMRRPDVVVLGIVLELQRTLFSRNG